MTDTDPAINFDVPSGLYMELFKARSDCFALQRNDGSYAPADMEFNESVLQEHLDGDITTGQYAVNPNDNTVKFAAIDNDIETDSSADLDNAFQAALEQKERALELGLKDSQAWLEFSGRRGYHLWVFFDPPVMAAKAKRLMEYIADGTPDEKEREKEEDDFEAGVQIEGGHTEVFPKQVRLSEKGYGNLIKTPLGIHQQTGDRMVFLKESGEPYEDQAIPLRAASRNRVTPETVDEILEEHDEDLEEIEKESSTASFGELEDVVQDDFDIRPCIRAAVLGELGELRGEQGHHMRLAVAAELLNNGYSVAEAHEVFKQFDNYDPKVTQRKLEELKREGHRPWSCSKLKSKCNAFTEDCPCPYQNIDAVTSMELNQKQYGKEWSKDE